MNWNDKTAANVKAIKPSGIRKFFDIAAQVKGVLSLSIGEPDFAAPDKVLAAMKASLDAKETSYTGNSGMMELREAISHHFEQRYGVHYDPKDEMSAFPKAWPWPSWPLPNRAMKSSSPTRLTLPIRRLSNWLAGRRSSYRPIRNTISN